MAQCLKLFVQFAIFMAAASHATLNNQSQNSFNRTIIPAPNGSGFGSIASNLENGTKNDETNGQSGNGHKGVASQPENGIKKEETNSNPESGTKNVETNGQSGNGNIAFRPENGTKSAERNGQSGDGSVASNPKNGTTNEETNGQSGDGHESVASEPGNGTKNGETNGQSGTESVASQPENGTKNEETIGQSGTESVASQPENGIKKQKTNGKNAYSINPFAQRMWKLFLVRKKRNPIFAAIGTFISNAATKVQGVIVDGAVKVGLNVMCSMNRDICPCGKGACIEHPGWKASICCGENFELKCCIDIPTTTPAPPEIVQVSRSCDMLKKKCNCGWGNCIRHEGKLQSTCCAQDYEFTCCTTVPTTTPTTPTTTLEPERLMVKICNEVAEACSCGWAKCVKSEGTKGGFCCLAGHVHKCCADPENKYQMVKRDTEDLVNELRKKDECASKNTTCVCGGHSGLYSSAGLKFMCCDTSSSCHCCEMDWPLHQTKPDFELPVARTSECNATIDRLYYDVKITEGQPACIWNDNHHGSDCCPENYRLIKHGRGSYITAELPYEAIKEKKILNQNESCPSGKWPIVRKRAHRYTEVPQIYSMCYSLYDGESLYCECNFTDVHTPFCIFVRPWCIDWFWVLEAVSKPAVKKEAREVKKVCEEAEKNCSPCGWAKCVPYPGWSASGCCDPGYNFECCATVLPSPIPGYMKGVTLPTMATKEIPPTISPTANEEANTTVNLLTSKMCCALASLLMMVLYFGNDHNQQF